MRIGPYLLANDLLLAPMAGVTDRPFRQLCRRLGAGLAVSEMVSSDASLRGTRKTVRRLDHRGEPGPISVQIVGADPRQMADAARANVDRGAQIIDINMGCPAKKVCKVAAGSALLRDEVLVGRILEAVVMAVDAPVTLKIRTGWSPEHRNGVQIARLAERCGVQALVVHGRTRACAYTGQAEYGTIRTIKAEAGIPIIANGDIDSPEKARRVLETTGADGLMLGRVAQGRPWIFRQVERYLRTGEHLPGPSPGEIRALLLEHLDSLYQFYGAEHGVKVARKHIGWYCKAQPGSGAFRQAVFRIETARQQRQRVSDYFNRLTEQTSGEPQRRVA